MLPWLRTVQACVPDSPVVLVATHIDRRPGISGATILHWEEVGVTILQLLCYVISCHMQELLGAVSQLSHASHTSRLGLPPIMQSVVMDCRNRDDVELLMSDVYSIALNMKLRHARVSENAEIWTASKKFD